ncbi:LPXTG-site transpeptidase (sortase) family protein [Bifidobacterium commune]|uniref:LPXTG-site transpeptidase (Sortase) family protein n=2 Tax=Bifidobacterium commune TaxID=1505727 RepID=A0A1C4H6C5_9BIFI|nr:LPXTG-site transpeptidase (sortase) family protein [Bifidobacterium commune]
MIREEMDGMNDMDGANGMDGASKRSERDESDELGERNGNIGHLGENGQHGNKRDGRNDNRDIELTGLDDAFNDFGDPVPDEPASAPWEQTQAFSSPTAAGRRGVEAGKQQSNRGTQNNFDGLIGTSVDKENTDYGNRSSRRKGASGSRRMWTVLGIVAEVLFTLAAFCALYIVWQVWWTGTQSEHEQVKQRESVSWSDPTKSADSQKNVNIANPQNGEAPVQPSKANPDDLIAQVYIPRFGDQWERTVVEGTDTSALNQHGLGHYTHTQMPGEVGNFAVAGHRAGYGQPLSDVDKLQAGDVIVVRTKDYWYVYSYARYVRVTPDRVDVVAPNPDNPNAKPTERMITLTTCDPKYSAPAPYRWISYGKLKYWAKVSDGVPAELTRQGQNGQIKFINNGQQSWASKLPSLIPVVIAALLIYAVLFILAAIFWRWPLCRSIRRGEVKRPSASIYGGLMRLQPGTTPVRVLLLLILLFAAAVAVVQWCCPWAAANIPILHEMSNYSPMAG